MAEIQDLLARNQELMNRMVAKGEAQNERFWQQHNQIAELLRKLKAPAPVRVDVQQPMVAEIVVKAEKVETERNDFVDYMENEFLQKVLSDLEDPLS